MGIRKRINKKMLGFGWAGYTCAALFIVIVTAIIVGVDLRYELLKLIQASFGDDAMILFVVRLPFALFAICNATISIVTAVALLLAFKIAPYRFSLFVQSAIFLLCTGWFLVSVAYFRVVGRAVFGPPQNGIFSMSGYYFLDIVGTVLVGLIVAYLTRSRLVVLMWMLAIAVELTEALWATNSGSLVYPKGVVIFTFFDIGQYTWFSLGFDLCTVGSLVLWAILERRKSLPEWACQACGYDLAGLPDDATCPECGCNKTIEDSPRHSPHAST